nr:hypothetical protein BaRGS_002465 [Batillaria attramentaria]
MVSGRLLTAQPVSLSAAVIGVLLPQPAESVRLAGDTGEKWLGRPLVELLPPLAVEEEAAAAAAQAWY